MTSTPYQVLARKYRPVLLKDLRGQEALVRTLSNAIDQGRIAHAFLLTGIRGVGKTTTARIIARSLNCIGKDGKGGPTTEPCGVCHHCTSIREDRHPDIMEMDAASRTGVGDIREIIESCRYLPVSARYKIYIIDEVHMLSTNAFNALLKTLEEPPPHIKFIFATTEIRKIPVTILSRCQRFDLRRVSSETLQEHLQHIASLEHINVEKEALRLIAEAAEGSVRDSLSLFDQAIAHHNSQQQEEGAIPASAIRGMLGLSDKTSLFDLLEHLTAGHIQEAVNQLHSLYRAGSETPTILGDLLELVHRITSIKITPSLADNSSLPENERIRGKKLAEQLSIPHLSRLWQMLLKGLQEAKQAPNPLAAAEMILIRIAYTADLPSPAAIIKELSSGGKTVTPTPPMQPAAPITTPAAPVAPARTPEPAPTSVIPDFKQLVDLFRQKRELLLYHALQNDVHLVNFAPGRLEIQLSPQASSDIKNKLEQCLMEWTASTWSVIISSHEGQPTLQQEADQRYAAIKNEAASHPVVKAVLEQFPGSAIGDVKERV